ncbi:MAG: signal peptidase I [Anaerolineae bacterium]
MEEFTQEHEEEPKSTSAQFILNAVWELVITVLPALLVALFINVFVAEAAIVEYGPSMQPNLYRGYRVMAEKVSYHLHPPHRGDVVIVDRPGNEVSLIKRVVALPGETVEVRGGHVFIDGQPIEEPWVTNFGGPSYPPTVVPPDHVFILGDNRSNSRDSRAIGPVPMDTIKGRVWLVYWPLDQIKLVP